MFVVDNYKKIMIGPSPAMVTGRIRFLADTESDKKYLKEVFNVAQRKYERMHSDTPAIRFQKSWTGEMGEAAIKGMMEKVYAYDIVESDKNVGAYGIDTDIQIRHRKTGRIFKLAVSGRKLSDKDCLSNIIQSPDQYFGLIPVDQYKNQYQQRDMSLYPFLLYNKGSFRNVTVEGIADGIGFWTEAWWISPGLLKKEDLVRLVDSNIVQVMKRGEKYSGLYGDMPFSVPMFADNYVIPVNLLRRMK